jgi:hypothetical protein
VGKGHCHCGAVRYAFDGEPVSATWCHCSLCRRLTGAACAPWCEVPSSALRWSGDGSLRTYPITERLAVIFCGNCGAPLAATHSAWPESTYLLMGALEEDSGIGPQYHIFTGSKARWHEICDSLPQYERWREEPGA